MSHTLRRSVTLALLTLCTLTAIPALGQPRPHRTITWDRPRLSAPAEPGRTIQLHASLTSRRPLGAARLRVSDRLRPIVQVEPAWLGAVPANRTIAVTITIRMPAEPARAPRGVIEVLDAGRVVPAPLEVVLSAPPAYPAPSERPRPTERPHLTPTRTQP